MLKRGVILMVVLVASLALRCSALPSDAELTRLMVGAWRSPRHDYIYFADGTWWMGNPDCIVTHGRWRIDDHVLVERTTYVGADVAPDKQKDDRYPITKLDQHEIIYGAYRLQRISLAEVDHALHQ